MFIKKILQTSYSQKKSYTANSPEKKYMLSACDHSPPSNQI